MHFRAMLERAVVAAALISLFAPLAFAQANTGTIVGTVTDASGATVPNCKVTATNLNTGVAKDTTTDSSGDYRISYLLPGHYEVAAEAPSFKRAVVSGLTLDVDQRARVSFTLELGAVTEKVEVAATAPLLQTQSVEQSQLVTETQMRELPINVRDFGQFASLQAGTVIGTGGLGNSFGGDNPQATGGAINVNGLGQDANNWQIDGVSNNEAFFSIISVNPSLDALQEVKVTTNNYSAEFGRAGGANVQAQIKSGTNQFHGGLFEFLRNDKLDANSFFNNASGAGKNPFRQNQFGGFLGGPIKRDKTFFFVDTELLRSREASSGIITIATPLQRQGIFTEAGQPTIYDPFTHQPFPNNTIPTSEINPAAANIMALLPNPNIPGAGIVNNFLGISNQAHDRSTFDVRVDQNFTERDQFFARYSYLETSLDTPPYLGTVLNGEPFANTAYTRNQNGVVSEVHTFSPSTINEARVGINRVRTDWDAYGANENTADQVGIPGINDFCGFCGGLPQIVISGVSNLGHTPFAPTRRHDTIWQFVDNVTLTRGRHTVKVGADVQLIQANLFQTTNPVGEFDFDKNMTSNQGDGGIGLASFLTGYYKSAGRAALQITPSARKKDLFFFGQDDFRVNSNLTLNLGLRYEVYTAPTDQHNRISNFDLATGDILLACIAVNCSGGIETQYGNLAPRIGVAYTPRGGKTTIRAGAGITYYSAGFGGQIGTLNDNYPWVTGQALTPSNIYTPGPSLSGGFPALPPVEQRPGAPPGHLIPKGGGAGNFSSVFYQPFDLKMPRVYQWSISVQHQLKAGFLIDVAYVANRQTNVFLNIDGNVPRPGSDPTGTLTLQERRPYYAVSPDLAGFTNRINAGLGRYNSMQLKVEKRFGSGFSFQSAYTVSKTQTTGNGPGPIDPFNYMVTSLANNDVLQRLVFSYVYELPFGRGKKFGNGWNRAVDAAFGGWQISGITNYQSGFPFNPTITSNLDNGEGNQPNRICDGRLDNRNIQRWFDTSCFVASPANVFGNSGYNVIRGPALRDWDITFGKNFQITEGMRLVFRADLLNIFNQVVFATPNAAVDTAGAGTISGTLAGTYPRRIQFGLKLYF
jgi:carboxypeptidase family protein